MSLVVMGTSYKTASIDARQCAAVPVEELPEALAFILACEGVREAVLVSTCNRVEAYVEAKTDRLGSEALHAFFLMRAKSSFDPECFYLHRGVDVVQHAFRVVCSLDSQVLGEAQILGQMRTAFHEAQGAGACGVVLSELFKRAIALGRSVRSETAIGSDSVSLSTVAHHVARGWTPDVSACRVLLVGTGEMAHLTARYLQDDGVGDVLVTSRTHEHARAFADEMGAQVVPYGERHQAAAECDIVFTMTAAPEAIICADELARARSACRSCPNTVLIDEAVPRDVEPACAQIPGVTVYDLEALQSIVDEGLATRMAAIPQVERMVDDAEQGFLSWMQERLVSPTIKAIREKGSLTVSAELDRAVAALAKEHGGQVTDAERRILEQYGNAIMKKILHGPTVRLRKEAQTADSYYYTGAARYLFGLEVFPPGTHHACHMRSCAKGEPCPMGLEGSLKDLCYQAERNPRATR